MHVKGMIWLGLRTTQFEEMVKFFRDVMSLQLIREEPELAGFQLNKVHRLMATNHSGRTQVSS